MKTLNIIKKIALKIVLSIFLLYGLNLVISSINVVIPINYYSVGLTTFLGIPGLCTIIALYFII